MLSYPVLIKENKRLFFKLHQQLAVANNRIITLQEEMERVKEESSYIMESNRKVTFTGFINIPGACQCVSSRESLWRTVWKQRAFAYVMCAVFPKTLQN